MPDETRKADAATDKAAGSLKDPLHPGSAAAAAGQPRTVTGTATAPATATPVAATQAESELVAFLRSQSPTRTAVGPTPQLDKTAPGGKYKVDGVWVNADGEELNADGSLKYPDRAHKDAFGRMTTVR